MEPKSSLPFSQNPETGPYAEVFFQYEPMLALRRVFILSYR